jgi:hypothetical protein
MANFIPGVACSDNPAAAMYPDGGSVLIAWKGEGNDQGIYWTRTKQSAPSGPDGLFTFDPSPQSWIEGVATSHSPALASFKGHVYMAWKGEDRDDRIFWSRYDGVKWQPQTPIPNAFTKIAPAIVATDSGVIVAWKNASDDNIWWGSSFHDNHQINFDVIGAIKVRGDLFQTSHTPALASDGTNIWMAWTGVGAGYLYWSACNRLNEWGPQVAVDPFNFSNGLGAGPTITGPAIQIVPGNALSMAWVAAVTPYSPDTARDYPYVNFSLMTLNSGGGWTLNSSYYAAGYTPALSGGEAFFFRALGDPWGIYYDYSNPPCFSGFLV